MDISSHSMNSDDSMDASFHSFLKQSTFIKKSKDVHDRTMISLQEIIKWMTADVNDSINEEFYSIGPDSCRKRNMQLPELHSFCCSGVGGFRSALLSGRVSDSELDATFKRSRWYVFVSINEVVLLNPRSALMLVWQCFNLVATVLCSLFVPVEVAFTAEEMGWWTQILGACFEIFFMLDIFANFNMPVYDTRNSRIIGDRAVIRQQYVRWWLWIDIISCLPLDLLEVCMGRDTIHHHFSVVRLVRVLKISKLVRLLRADMIIRILQDYMSVTHEEVQFVKLLFLVLMTIHFMGCGLFVIAELEDTHTNWLEENHILGAVGVAKYACAMYWATMTATTIGYGDVEMITPFERMYATVCMIIGASVYAFITSRLVGMLLTSSSGSGSPLPIVPGGRGLGAGKAHHIMDDFEGTIRRVSELPVVHRAVIADYLANRVINRVTDGTKVLIEALSPKLQALVGRSIYQPMICGIPFLCPRGCRGDVQDSLCGDIALSIDYCTYMPGEVIIHNNEYVTNWAGKGVMWGGYSVRPRSALYIVDKGVVLMRRLRGVQILNKFEYFGEDTVLLGNSGKANRYEAVSSTVQYCGLFILDKDCIVTIVNKYPFLQQNFQRCRVKLAFRLGVVRAIQRIIRERRGREGTVISEDRRNMAALSSELDVSERIGGDNMGGEEAIKCLITEVKSLRLQVVELSRTVQVLNARSTGISSSGQQE